MKALAVALLLAFASVAHAQAPADPEITAIQDAFNGNRFGEMHTLATALVAKRPDDAWVRYLAAVAAMRTVRFDEALAHCDAGLAKTPGDANLLGLRASLELSLGDERGARADARRALASDPEAADAVDVAALLDLSDRARDRRAGTAPSLRPGSAAAFVDGLLADVARGASVDSIAKSFHPQIVDQVPGAGPRDRVLREAIGGAFDAARAGGQEFLGWEVSPEEHIEGAVTWVDVQVPFETTFTAAQRATLETALSEEALRETIPADVLVILEGVPADERGAMLDRMVGSRTRAVMNVAFDTRQEANGDWRVRDIVLDGVSLRKNAAAYTRLGSSLHPERPRRDRAYQAGKAVGYLLGILLVVYFVVRFRKRI